MERAATPLAMDTNADALTRPIALDADGPRWAIQRGAMRWLVSSALQRTPRSLQRLLLLSALAIAGCGGNSGGGGSSPATEPVLPGPAPTYTVGGTVSGLAGRLQLQNQAGVVLDVVANGPFTIGAGLPTGAAFSVTALSQPSTPSQTCTVTNGAGSVANGNISNVVVNCSTNTFAVRGTVSGLAGPGLVLRLNGSTNLDVSADGAFSAGAAIASGTAYSVVVQTQPSTPSQTCTVSNGSGTVGNAGVDNVTVACTVNTYSVGGTVSGLLGTGLVLGVNGASGLAVSAAGGFTFPTALASGGAYAVTVLAQPTSPSQTCVVGSGAGTVGGAPIGNVAVSCTTNTYTVGGTVSGLLGTGLVLRVNGVSNLAVSANGALSLGSALASGASYTVTVLSQPGAPSQTCGVTNGVGTVTSANVNNVAVICTTNAYTVGGTVSGLVGSGLVLGINGANSLAVSASGGFTFPTALASGGAYAVTVLAQPASPSQTCTVAAGAGTVRGGPISNVGVVCTTNSYAVGGLVNGLLGSGLVLRVNGASNLAISTNGAFNLGAPLASGSNYAVVVLTQPTSPSQTCAVTGGSGTVANVPVNNISVSCSTNTYTVGGAVSGLLGTGLVLRINGVSNLAVSSNGAFNLGGAMASGTAYSVAVINQPSAPTQTCAVTNGAGTVGSAPVNNIAVACTTAGPNPPTLSSSASSSYVDQSVRFEGVATDPNGLTLTYLWDFGDGAGASTPVATRTYTAAGTFTVRLTVNNSAGGSSSATLSHSVVSTAPNTLVPDCAGPGCGATGPNAYAGSGVGVWRYRNSSANPATVDLNFSGVAPGKTVTLLFSNGSTATAASLPSPGVSPTLSAAPVAKSAQAVLAALSRTHNTNSNDNSNGRKSQMSEQDQHDEAHTRMLAANAALARSLWAQREPVPAGASAGAAAAPAQPVTRSAPTLNTVRSWNDLYNGTPTPYSTTAKAVCAGPNGRNVVIWVDPNAEISGRVTAASITAYADSLCGPNGSLARLTSLTGDVWGPPGPGLPALMPDSPLQDVNIVFLNAPASSAWGGYFYGVNNYRRTSRPDSNEALAVFINASRITSQDYTQSILVHETTHMINFYQRSLLRNSGHDTWLEETTAMMGEDVVTPTVVRGPNGSGYNPVVDIRLPAYVASGGAVSYINWPVLSLPNYSMGGAFGAFINRRYGVAIYRQLTTGCTAASITSSYACLDSLIKDNGGQGFSDEFAHFGASIFGLLPASGVPNGYGFRAKTDGSYVLAPVDVSALAAQRPATATALGSGYTATTHTYQVDTVPAGRTSYVRNGVVVPANTSLIVLIQ